MICKILSFSEYTFFKGLLLKPHTFFKGLFEESRTFFKGLSVAKIEQNNEKTKKKV